MSIYSNSNTAGPNDTESVPLKTFKDDPHGSGGEAEDDQFGKQILSNQGISLSFLQPMALKFKSCLNSLTTFDLKLGSSIYKSVSTLKTIILWIIFRFKQNIVSNLLSSTIDQYIHHSNTHITGIFHDTFTELQKPFELSDFLENIRDQKLRESVREVIVPPERLEMKEMIGRGKGEICFFCGRYGSK